MKKPWIYVAGPYTKPDPVVNARNAIITAIALRDLGCVPICPHLSMLAHLVSPQPYEFWMRWDFDLLEKCDAVLRLDGDSPGADQETALADTLGIPVLMSMAALKNWCDFRGK